LECRPSTFRLDSGQIGIVTNPTTGQGRQPTASTERMVPARFLAITGGVGVVLALVAFGVGRLTGHGSIEAELEERDASLVERDKEVAEVRKTLSRTELRLSLLETHSAIYRAIAELDRRNFGIANDVIQQAAKSLAQVEARKLGLDKKELAELHTKVEGLRLEFDADVGAQRESLFAIAGQLDRMVTDSK